MQLMHISMSNNCNTGMPDGLAHTTSNFTSPTFKFDSILAHLTNGVGDLCTGNASMQVESGCEI